MSLASPLPAYPAREEGHLPRLGEVPCIYRESIKGRGIGALKVVASALTTLASPRSHILQKRLAGALPPGWGAGVDGTRRQGYLGSDIFTKGGSLVENKGTRRLKVFPWQRWL
jgi:hypothetical protein